MEGVTVGRLGALKSTVNATRKESSAHLNATALNART